MLYALYSMPCCSRQGVALFGVPQDEDARLAVGCCIHKVNDLSPRKDRIGNNSMNQQSNQSESTVAGLFVRLKLNSKQALVALGVMGGRVSGRAVERLLLVVLGYLYHVPAEKLPIWAAVRIPLCP